jgi:hypothetical protein
MEATNIEAFDIHFNDKYRWDWEGPFDIPGDGYFDVTFIANGYNEKEMKGREESLHDICRTNRGEYLPELAKHLYLSWPTVFFAAHPRLKPPVPPNIFTETLGERDILHLTNSCSPHVLRRSTPNTGAMQQHDSPGCRNTCLR